MKTVLIIEDDKDIVDLISIHIRDLNLDLKYEYTGTDGLKTALSCPIDLYILDVMLPGVDGLEICKQIRAAGILSPIMMLTAKSDEIDKVLGLEIGADDYLTKPFGIREFISRVKALLRRHEMNQINVDMHDNDHIILGEISVDKIKRKVLLKNQAIDLTPKEYELLLLLAQNPGQTFSRRDLISRIWGYEFEGYEHTVNSHINRLRAKVEKDPAKPEYILTAWGVGYKSNDDLH